MTEYYAVTEALRLAHAETEFFRRIVRNRTERERETVAAALSAVVGSQYPFGYPTGEQIAAYNAERERARRELVDEECHILEDMWGMT